MDPIASEVNGQVEQELPAGQVQQGASETVQATQEPQQQPTTFTPEQVEQMRREWQSRKDREVYEARMTLIREQETLRQHTEEQARLDGMDDEEFGAHMRQQMARQQEQQRLTDDERTRTLRAIQEQTLEAIPDAGVRKQIEDKINSGQYTSWQAMTQDVIALVATCQAQAAAAKAVQDALAANNRDMAAQLASTPVPVTAPGIPARQSSLAGLSPDRLLAEGFAEEIAKQRRQRGG